MLQVLVIAARTSKISAQTSHCASTICRSVTVSMKGLMSVGLISFRVRCSSRVVEMKGGSRTTRQWWRMTLQILLPAIYSLPAGLLYHTHSCIPCDISTRKPTIIASQWLDFRCQSRWSKAARDDNRPAHERCSISYDAYSVLELRWMLNAKTDNANSILSSSCEESEAKLIASAFS